MIVYHIVTLESWEAQRLSDCYVHESLHEEGFIHLSKEHQLAGVLDRYYQDVENLIQLTINTDLLRPDIEFKEELASSINEYFPHIYGQINKSAIIEVERIR